MLQLAHSNIEKLTNEKAHFFQAIKLSQYLCDGKSQPIATLPVLWCSFNYRDSRDFPHVRKILPRDTGYQLSPYILYYNTTTLFSWDFTMGEILSNKLLCNFEYSSVHQGPTQ